ncbi:MAG: LamG-like jellyroll fold domain-containing protein [Pirellulales bacterium]|nr:LamG-like jellyroll fold domain-containing protein [Pirellulales bacterium]
MTQTAPRYPKRNRRNVNDEELVAYRGNRKPWLDPYCHGWWDPMDLSTLTLWPVHGFGNSNKSYLSTPTAPELNAGSQLTLEMWVNLKAITADRAFCSKSVYASDVCGWAVGGGGGSNQGNTVVFWLRTPGGAWISCSTPAYAAAVGEQLSHFVITYNAGTVKIWRNGVSQTVTPSAAIPATIGANNTALQIGNWSVYAGTSNFGCGVFRYWTADIGDTLAAALYGTGEPTLYDNLPSAYKSTKLVAALDGDSKICKHTGRVFSDTLTVDAEKVCTRWRDKSRYGRHLSATFGRGYWQSTINSAPNSALRGYVQNIMGGSTANALNNPTGSVFLMHQFDTLYNAECFYLTAEGDNGNSTGKYGIVGSKYLDPSGAAPLANYPWLRMRNDLAGTGGDVQSQVAEAAYAAGVPYLINWNGLETGDAASFTYFCNGVQHATIITQEGDALPNEPTPNEWFNVIGNTDTLYVGGGLGGLANGGGQYYAGRRGMVALFGPRMSSEYRRYIEVMISQRYGNVL